MDYSMNRLNYARNLPSIVDQLSSSSNFSTEKLMEKLKQNQQFKDYDHPLKAIKSLNPKVESEVRSKTNGSDKEILFFIFLEMTREREMCNKFVEILKLCGTDAEYVANHIQSEYNVSFSAKHFQLTNNIDIDVLPSLVDKHMDSSTYDLRGKPKGLCIILNNIEEKQRDDHKFGLINDTKRFEYVFKKLDFTVKVLRNSNKTEIETDLINLRNNNSLKKGQAFVMIVISHGNDECILGYDGCKEMRQSNPNSNQIFADLIEIQKLINIFSEENCKNWEKIIPKLHFFICCRIKYFEHGDSGTHASDIQVPMQTEQREQQLVEWHESKKLIDKDKTLDTFVCYACAEGSLALYDPNVGMSYFGNVLTHNIAFFACDRTLNEIMLRTSERLKELYPGIKKNNDLYKQNYAKSNDKTNSPPIDISAKSFEIEVQISSLTKHIYLNPKPI